MLQFTEPLLPTCTMCGGGMLGDEAERAAYRYGQCDACICKHLERERQDLISELSKYRRAVQLMRIYLHARAPHILEALQEALHELGHLPGEAQ